MGCDFFYEGSIKDRGLQKESINFVKTYFDHIENMLELTHLEGVHLPVISRFAESLYGYHYPLYPVDYPFNGSSCRSVGKLTTQKEYNIAKNRNKSVLKRGPKAV